MTRQLILAAASAALLAIGACDATGPDFSEDGFTVEAEPGQLVLRNRSSAVVSYVAMEEGTLAVSSLDLVASVEEWPRIDPGGRVVIRNEELIGYSESATRAAIVWALDFEVRPAVVVTLR